MKMSGFVHEYVSNIIILLLFCLTPVLFAQDCDGYFNATRDDTRLTSPGYYTNYQNNMDCTYLITAPAGERVFVTTTDINLEKSEFCSKDFILVIDGPVRTGQILTRTCEFGISVLSTGRHLTITFQTDGDGTARGFHLLYRTVDNTEDCPVQSLNAFNADSAIVSPFFPANYPTNTDCEWRISAPKDYIVYIEIKQSAIEESEECNRDYVQVYEASYKGGGFTIGKWCGSEVPSPIHSPGMFMTVVFHSDGQITDQGFRIVYSARPKSDFPDLPEKNDRSLVVGVVAGVIAVVVLVVVVGFVCVIRRRKSRRSNISY